MPPVGDEQIISAVIAAENKKRQTITSDATIDGVTYQFEKRELSLGFAIVLPKSFRELPPGLVKVKYPYEDRPKIILTDESTEASNS